MFDHLVIFGTGVCREACYSVANETSSIRQVCERVTAVNCTADIQCAAGDSQFCDRRTGKCQNVCPSDDVTGDSWLCDTSGYTCQNGYCLKVCPNTSKLSLCISCGVPQLHQ